MAPKRPKPWTEEDDEVLRQLWDEDATAQEMAAVLGRSESAVYDHANNLGLTRRRNAHPWTRTELDTLRKLFDRGLSDTEIAARFDNRTLEAIRRQRAQQGLLRHDGGPEKKIERPTLFVGPARTCQYFTGDPRVDEIKMCGRKSVKGRSYCAEHARLCYQQPSAQKPKKAEWKGPI